MTYRFDLETTTVDDCRREIDRLRAELAKAETRFDRRRDAHERDIDAIARVRELCDKHNRVMLVADIRAALEGNRT